MQCAYSEFLTSVYRPPGSCPCPCLSLPLNQVPQSGLLWSLPPHRVSVSSLKTLCSFPFQGLLATLPRCLEDSSLGCSLCQLLILCGSQLCASSERPSKWSSTPLSPPPDTLTVICEYMFICMSICSKSVFPSRW